MGNTYDIFDIILSSLYIFLLWAMWGISEKSTYHKDDMEVS